ncbi:uncharacterized protein [Drosophila suzukii]|uniref:Uncharacterized protein n=1 Tax=Drosophila suzukii TaxID=28584 RepID=A0ABM4TNR5_DROSZ
MKTASYSRQWKAVYRRCALRITSSFCTVSEEAALVVAGTIPIDLPAAERRTGSTGSRTQRSNTIEAWQRRWNNATHRAMISGHGCFKEYLHRFKHEPNPYYDLCGMLENQSKWDAKANMAAGILKDLRRRERSRRSES